VTKRVLAIFVVLLLAGTVGLLAGCGGGLPGNGVAKVGNIVITKTALDQKIADVESQYPGQTPDKTSDPEGYKTFTQQVLDYMITYQLASQYAAQNQLTVTDDEVQKELDASRDQYFGGDQAKFDEALKQQGLTLDQVKASYKESMLMQKVYDGVTKDVTTVPDSEIQAYYDQHKTDYYVDETRTARHILIAPDAGRVDGTTSTTSTSSTTSTTAGSATGSSDDTSTSDTSTPTASSSTTTTAAPTEADWNAALDTANKVRADLVAGADWTAEAAKYSDDPGTKAKGGDLGTISKGEMVKEFEDAVFSLAKDEISQPVKTAYGYHIIQVTGVNEAKQYTLDEVKEDIKSSLLSEKKSAAWRSWIDTQKAAAGVVYASDWTPTTTTGSSTTSTTPASDTTQTTAGESTTTTAGATITTAAPTTTTAKP
jgi:parvulin-like peptidyl-prolyl isomerase